jgi:hypothetical protein
MCPALVSVMKWQAALIGLLSCLFHASIAKAESELKLYTLPIGTPLCVKALPSWGFGKAFEELPLKLWEFGPPVPDGYLSLLTNWWRRLITGRAGVLRPTLRPVCVNL